MRYFRTKGYHGSFFSAAETGTGGGGAAAADPAGEEKGAAGEDDPAKGTKAELDVEQLKADLAKSNNDAVKKAIADALAKAKLSPEELAKVEADEKKAAVDAKEQELAQRERRIDATAKLAEKGYSKEFVDFVVGADAEETGKKIDLLDTLVKKQAQELVAKVVKGKALPGTSGGGTGTATGGNNLANIIRENQVKRN